MVKVLLTMGGTICLLEGECKGGRNFIEFPSQSTVLCWLAQRWYTSLVLGLGQGLVGFMKYLIMLFIIRYNCFKQIYKSSHVRLWCVFFSLGSNPGNVSVGLLGTPGNTTLQFGGSTEGTKDRNVRGGNDGERKIGMLTEVGTEHQRFNGTATVRQRYNNGMLQQNRKFEMYTLFNC